MNGSGRKVLLWGLWGGCSLCCRRRHQPRQLPGTETRAVGDPVHDGSGFLPDGLFQTQIFNLRIASATILKKSLTERFPVALLVFDFIYGF